MIQPTELKLNLPMKIANDVMTTTGKVWDILVASKNGDLQSVKRMVNDCPELIFAQYNYTPPIHFAVREGHVELVRFLLDNGAYDPTYRTYPFLDTLPNIAHDKGYYEIALMLESYSKDPSAQKFKGDNGEIFYNRSEQETEFEKAVYKANIRRVEELLKLHPEYAKDETFCWSEGILLFPVKEGHWDLVDLLMSYGATVPKLLKWAQYYYFERYEHAVKMMERGMDANITSWQHVTLLHDMAQKGEVEKAKLLVRHGADINAIDEEYSCTPLGMSVRWKQPQMISYLQSIGAV